MKAISKRSSTPARALEAEAVRIRSLSDEEREVSTLVAKGLTNDQIAGRLSTSPRTVRRHLTSIFGKLEISNRFELIILCYRHHLIKPP